MNRFSSSLLSLIATWALAASLVGCESPTIQQSATSAKSTPKPEAEEETVMVAGAPGEALPEIETPVTDVPRKFNSHDPIKGRRSRDAGGTLGAVGGARFHIEYQTIINNIDYALRLYEAEHGEYPKSHEEFWEKIIVANGTSTKPPEIEPDHEYIYVPEQATVGLQIRLKPGSPSSSLPAPAPGQEHVFQTPTEEAPVAAATTDETAADQPAAETAESEPSPNIRVRAGGLGDQLNSRTQEQLDAIDNDEF